LNSFSKHFPSTIDVLPDIESFVSKTAKQLGLQGTKLEGFTLAASEAASNSIVHGNKMDFNKDITVELYLESGTIVLKIFDKGCGFELEKIPDPTSPENILKDSGRGIYIMRSFLTDLQYKFSEDGTTTFLFLKV